MTKGTEMTLFTKITGLAITSVALAAPIAHASSTAPLTAAQTARLGAQTEAQSFKGIDRYLRQQHAEQTAQAGAETEAASFKGIQKYLEQRFGYSLGEYARTVSEHDAPAWLQALEAQSDALNRQYGLGKYARAVDAKASAWHKTPADTVHAFYTK
jgi:hypothetical protein